MMRLPRLTPLHMLAVALVLAPLERATHWPFDESLSWNAYVGIQVLTLAFAYFCHIRSTRASRSNASDGNNTKRTELVSKPVSLREKRTPQGTTDWPVLTAVLVTVLLIGAVGTGSLPSTNWSLILFYVVAIWWVPLIYNLAARGQTILIVASALAVAALQAWWGLLHFGLQMSLGHSWLGETVLTLGQPGIATFTTTIGKLVRGYGPFPHPNILAGSLLLALILLAATPQLWQRRSFTTPLIFIIVLGILATFSRAAVIGLLVLGLALMAWKISGARHWLRHSLLLPMLLTLIVFTPLWLERSSDQRDEAVADRHGGARNWLLVGDYFGWTTGLGPGNYTAGLRQYAEKEGLRLESWEYQPIHSTPPLVLIEWGVALSIVLGIILLIHSVVAKSPGFLLLTALLPPLFLDHYWLTHGGSLLFLAVGYSLLTSRAMMRSLWRAQRNPYEQSHTID